MSQTRGNQRDFLGVGWKFPLQVTPGGQIAQARYEQRIEESIYLILSTAKGERVMLPEFGCGIHDLVFAPNNSTTIAVVVQTVREALVAFEPRIDVLDISAERAPEEPKLLQTLGKLTGLDLELRDDPMIRLDEFRLMSRPAGRDVTELYAVA